MTLSIEDATRFAQVFKGLVDGVSVAVLDKRQAVRLALTTMFAGGHLLLEDAPGTGKTALARAISATIDGTHSRIQFTPDLLPSDITGVNMFNQKTGEWVFHAGPVFAEIVLADEINRASPKTQSALLEVMEEAQVTVDGVRRPVAPSAWCAAPACGRPRRAVTSSCPTTSRPWPCPCGRTALSSTRMPRSRARPPRASSSVP